MRIKKDVRALVKELATHYNKDEDLFVNFLILYATYHLKLDESILNKNLTTDTAVKIFKSFMNIKDQPIVGNPISGILYRLLHVEAPDESKHPTTILSEAT